MHQEIKIQDGVYVTNFNKKQSIKGLNDNESEAPKDLGLLLDEIQSYEKKIEKLIQSNEAIKEQEDWQKDEILLEAIEQNLAIIIRFSEEMKEKIVQIFSMNYKPENEKMEKLVDAKRISDRQEKTRNQLVHFQKKYRSEEKNNQNENKDQGVYL